MTDALRRKNTEDMTLRLGLAEHAAGEQFTRLAFELEHRKPPIRIDLSEILPSEAIRSVLGGALDVAIVLETGTAPGLKISRAWSDPLFLLAPLGHALGSRDRVSLTEIKNERFVLPDPKYSPGCAAQLEALFVRYGVVPVRRVNVEHQNAMTSLVAAGKGLAFLPGSIAEGLTTVVVVPVAEVDACFDSWLLYRADEESSEPLAFVLEVAGSINAEAPGGWTAPA